MITLILNFCLFVVVVFFQGPDHIVKCLNSVIKKVYQADMSSGWAIEIVLQLQFCQL